MKNIRLGSEQLTVKDYHCAGMDGVYIPKTENKLWLYINITSQCNAQCPFCANREVNTISAMISPEVLRRTLVNAKSHICGVSITGGEPMLHPRLIDEVASVVTDVMGNEIHLELVTNGTNLEYIPNLKLFDRFAGIHISRHVVDDEKNRLLMGFAAPSFTRIKKLVSQLKDPGKIVLNCVMQKNGVETEEDVRAYLEKAAWAGIDNVSFVGMFLANHFCTEHYVSPVALNFNSDQRFSIWNQFHDYNHCSCCSGDYQAENGYVRFYYRCPGAKKAQYVRQLVYNHDDRLLMGFGGKEITF